MKNQRRDTTLSEFASLEAAVGAPLPPKFRKFLMQDNGGIPVKPLYANEQGHRLYVQAFFPLGNVANNLEEEWRCMPYSLPHGVIPIALEGGGGRICLDLKTDAIYSWDHERVEENGKITWDCLIRLEDDIFAFVESFTR